MALVRETSRDIPRLLRGVLRSAGAVLSIIFVCRAISSEVFNFVAQRSQGLGGDTNVLFTSLALQALFDLAWGTAWTFLLIRSVKVANSGGSLLDSRSLSDFNQLLIENIRAVAAMIWRIPFLIVPALVEYVRLTFVSHIVLLDPKYQRGEVDALQRSRDLVKGRFLMILVLMIILSLIPLVSAQLMQGGDIQWPWEHPLSFLLKTAFLLFMHLVFEIFLVALFLRILEKTDADVRLDTN